jgi:hypothetical protein
MPRFKRDRIDQTLHQVTVDALGMKRGVLVQTLVSVWSMFRYERGRDPENVAELVEEAGRSTASVYRWLEHFRECFPDYADPGALLDACEVPMHRALSPFRVGALHLPAGDES